MSDFSPIALTERREFWAVDNHVLFTVNADVPVSDALELASSLLGGARRLLLNGLDDPDDRAVSHTLLETGHTLLEASLAGIQARERELAKVDHRAMMQGTTQ